MTRARGQLSQSHIRRLYPHCCRLLQPGNGFGNFLNEINDFTVHHEYGKTSERIGDHCYVNWRFAGEATARQFCETFGAEYWWDDGKVRAVTRVI